MSLAEIFDYVNAMVEKENEKRKHDAKERFVQAQIIAEQVSSVLSDEARPRMLWEIYPGIFEQERIDYEQATEIKQIEEAKQSRMQRAELIAQQRFMAEMDKLEKEGGM